METTITISNTIATNESDFLHLTYNTIKSSKDAMISVDSRYCERVSWNKSDLFSCKVKPPYSNKRKNINIKDVENEVMKDINNIAMPNCPFPASINIDNEKDEEAESKSLILVRCDFKKVANVQPLHPKLNPLNHSTSLIKYLKEEQRSTFPNMPVSTCTSKVEAHKEMIQQRHKSEPSQSVSNNAANREPCSSSNLEGQENTEHNGYASLSPESRKKELCRYLKLMNPADKIEVLKLENRRSTRVRNLTVMEEQKQHEKLKKIEIERQFVREKSVPRSTVESFKELNINVEKFEDFKSNGDVGFCVPFPSQHLLKEVNNFDTVMSSLVPKFKRICDKKNIQYTRFDRESVKSSEAVRDNLPEVLGILNERKTPSLPKSEKNSAKAKKVSKKKKGKTKKIKNNSERKNSLRSKGKLKRVSLKKIIAKKDKEKARWKLLKQEELRKQLRTTAREETSKTPVPVRSRKNSEARSLSSDHKIVSPSHSLENNVDLENFMDDMVDFNSLSDEHRKCLIENRIISRKPLKKAYTLEERNTESFSSLQTLPLYGLSKPGKLAAGNSQPKPISDLKSSSPKSNKLTHQVKEKGDRLKSDKKCKEKQDHYMSEKVCKETEDHFTKGKIPKGKEDNFVREQTSKEKADNFPKEKPKEKPTNKNGGTVLSPIVGGNTYLILNIHRPDIQVQSQKTSTPSSTVSSLNEHDYAGTPDRQQDVEEDPAEVDVVTVPTKNIPAGNYVKFNTKQLRKDPEYALLPYKKNVEMKSLHKSLQFGRKRNNNITMDSSLAQEWDSDGSPKQRLRKTSHSISISRENGTVMKAFYIDYNLIVCQEFLISFWMQTPLGNVLGSQDMWVPRGHTQRIVPNNKCVQKESMERVICSETSVVYIELWMKEHKSEMRQGPVTDVFITLYFWKQRQNGLDKKVLQLENINGFADDVQYSVMKSSQKIIVSWHCTNEDNVSKRTFIHAYLLAPDYQTVSNIFNIEPVDHYVSSLHNIEECENLMMGCGENKITLWNVEFGYIIATVELKDIKSPLSTLWVKCDRGFLFALQQCVDRELRLIAINGINHSWKKLASYFPPEGFDRLRGVCVENGLLLSFYDKGILCWNAETGEPVEEVNLETDIIPSGKHVILVEDNQIFVKHVMTHLMSMSVEES